MARTLLVSYPGYPSTPRHLVANSWLANTAGALLAAGHEARIVDYGTVAMMRRLFPEALTAQLKPIATRQMTDRPGNPDVEQLGKLQELAAHLDAHQQQTTNEAAEELLAQVRREKPDLVGFDLSDGDGFSGSVTMAEMLHAEFPKLHICAGGRKAAWFRKLIFRTTNGFDTIGFGDPEVAVVRLAEFTEGKGRLQEIPGIVYEDSGQAIETPRDDSVSLDELALPAYDTDTYPAMAGDEKIKMVILTDSRGCPNRCAFCVHPMEDGGRQRIASATKIADVMQTIQQLHGISVFRFGGSSTPGSLMYEVAREIIRRGLDVQYNTFGHFRSANPDHFQLMAQSGLYSIFFGLESGSQEILDKAVHKGIKLAEVEPTLHAAQAAGIFAAASMIVPLPFDTQDTLAESLNFVTRLRPDSVPLQFPGVLPGTPWIENPQHYGIEIDDVERFLLDNLDYRFELLFPPQFWDPLPYKINGMSFHEFTAVTMQFARQLEEADILTNFSHTLAAIAQSAEMAPRQLRDMAQLWCVTGDAEAMGSMVEKANRGIIRR
jgi:anaerobic magnesium-protoporphyrin IX monomethyl ester cyclase